MVRPEGDQPLDKSHARLQLFSLPRLRLGAELNLLRAVQRAICVAAAAGGVATAGGGVIAAFMRARRSCC
jgi:hypothetical protein